MRIGILDRVRRWARLRGPRPLRPRKSGPLVHVRPADPGERGAAGRHRRDGDGWPEQTQPQAPSQIPARPSPASGPPSTASPGTAWPGPVRRGGPPVARPSGTGSGSGAGAVRSGPARARIRTQPGVPVPRAAEAAATGEELAVARPDAGQAADRAAGVEQVAGQGRRDARGSVWRSAPAALRERLPFAAPHARDVPPTADGRRDCGSLERVLWRQWDMANPPPPEVIAAVDRLAELPERIKERLADGLDAIFVGPGGVPELDDMTALRGVRLPSGRASWDVCAGAYGERKIVVGSRPSPTPDVMCHEVGHALDDLDSPPGKWQSDSAEFRVLYDQCRPHFASDFHRQPGGLGRKEFFADAFAAIASGQRPALVDMLGGETRTALRVMLYFNRRYDI